MAKLIAEDGSPLPFAAIAGGGQFPPVVIPFFALLFALLAVWLILLSWLFSRLRNKHPSTYEAMGSPSLVRNNSMRNNWLFFKFLFSSHWRELGDSTVASLVRLLRLVFAVYLVVFMTCVTLMFLLV